MSDLYENEKVRVGAQYGDPDSLFSSQTGGKVGRPKKKNSVDVSNPKTKSSKKSSKKASKKASKKHSKKASKKSSKKSSKKMSRKQHSRPKKLVGGDKTVPNPKPH